MGEFLFFHTSAVSSVYLLSPILTLIRPSNSINCINFHFIRIYWTDAQRPVPRLWIRSAEVRGGGTSFGEWEHT